MKPGRHPGTRRQSFHRTRSIARSRSSTRPGSALVPHSGRVGHATRAGPMAHRHPRVQGELGMGGSRTGNRSGVSRSDKVAGRIVSARRHHSRLTIRTLVKQGAAWPDCVSRPLAPPHQGLVRGPQPYKGQFSLFSATGFGGGAGFRAAGCCLVCNFCCCASCFCATCCVCCWCFCSTFCVVAGLALVLVSCWWS